jgi:hypothetical protein
MYIVKILKRRDAASLVVAIVLAMILGYTLNMPAMGLANQLSDVLPGGTTQGFTEWKFMYFQPLVSGVLQVILLEIVLRLVVPLRAALVRRKK